MSRGWRGDSSQLGYEEASEAALRGALEVAVVLPVARYRRVLRTAAGERGRQGMSEATVARHLGTAGGLAFSYRLPRIGSEATPFDDISDAAEQRGLDQIDRIRRAVGATLRSDRHPCRMGLGWDAGSLQMLAAHRLSEWREVDLDSCIWTIPADRSKTRREHKVPLAPLAVAVLDEARRLSHGEGLIFASVTGQPREVAEACLAHAVKSKVEAAYARSDLLNRRRILMQAWADYLSDTA